MSVESDMEKAIARANEKYAWKGFIVGPRFVRIRREKHRVFFTSRWFYLHFFWGRTGSPR